MSKNELCIILEKGDDDACLRYFSGMNEKSRRALAKDCIKWFKEISKERVVEIKRNSYGVNPLWSAAAIAMFCVSNLTELKKVHIRDVPPRDKFIQIIKDRNPKWIQDYVLFRLEKGDIDWHLYRGLMQEGLIEKPDHPSYYLSLISVVSIFNQEDSIKDNLLESDDILKEDIWRLFEYEGGGDLSLANHDQYCRHQKNWQDTFIELVNEKLLDRGRILSNCVQALQRDFNHYRAKWFIRLYDALETTSDEDKKFANEFLHMLSMSAPNIITWAFKKVDALHKADALESNKVITILPILLSSRGKGLVRGALKVCDRILRTNTEKNEEVCLLVIKAFAHEDLGIQKASMRLLKKYADNSRKSIKSEASKYMSIVSPVLREDLALLAGEVCDNQNLGLRIDECEGVNIDAIEPRLRKLYGLETIRENINSGIVEVPLAEFKLNDLPILKKHKKITPLDDIEVWIELCAKVLEDAANVDEIELVFDGMARIHQLVKPGQEKMLEPIIKRSNDVLYKEGWTPFLGNGPKADLAGLLCVLVYGKNPEIREVKGEYNEEFEVEIGPCVFSQYREKLHDKRPIRLLSLRSLALANDISRSAVYRMLSLPTHESGWVDPAILVERVNGWGNEDPDPSDVKIAMMRLAPEDRLAAVKKLKESEKEWVCAIRYALGGDEDIGVTPDYWAIASRVRNPIGHDDKVKSILSDAGPDTYFPAEYKISTIKGECYTLFNICSDIKGREYTPATFYSLYHYQLNNCRDYEIWLGGNDENSMAWASSINLTYWEPYFAVACSRIAGNIDWDEANWEAKYLLLPLLNDYIPMGRTGLLLLAVGLAAKEPGESGLAIDIAIKAIEDGRLGSDSLGDVIAELLSLEFIKLGRWSKTLREIAQVSSCHALVVKLALEKSLTGDPLKLQRDYAKLLELLYELSADLAYGIQSTERRDFLASIKGGNKSAKAAKAILKLPIESSAVNVNRAMTEALSMRSQAASSWM